MSEITIAIYLGKNLIKKKCQVLRIGSMIHNKVVSLKKKQNSRGALAHSDLPFALTIVAYVVVDFLFIVTPIVGVCNSSMFCCTLLYVHSSIAIILMGKRELFALLYLSSWCLVMVERLFLAVPGGYLKFVIVVFPDHAYLLFRTQNCSL